MRKATSQVRLQRCNPNRTAAHVSVCQGGQRGQTLLSKLLFQELEPDEEGLSCMHSDVYFQWTFTCRWRRITSSPLFVTWRDRGMEFAAKLWFVHVFPSHPIRRILMVCQWWAATAMSMEFIWVMGSPLCASWAPTASFISARLTTTAQTGKKEGIVMIKGAAMAIQWL